MTNLEYARLLIKDTDATNQIFTDLEIQEIIKKYSKMKILKASKIDLDGKIWDIGKIRLDETFSEKFYNEYDEKITATIDKETGIITTSEAQYEVKALVKYIIWQNVHAKLLEIIATDIRKWNSYSINGLSEKINKNEILQYARSLYIPLGSDLE